MRIPDQPKHATLTGILDHAGVIHLNCTCGWSDHLEPGRGGKEETLAQAQRVGTTHMMNAHDHHHH